MAIGVFEKKVSHEASPVKQSIHTFLTEEPRNITAKKLLIPSHAFTPSHQIYIVLLLYENSLTGWVVVLLLASVAFQPAAIIFASSALLQKNVHFPGKKNAIERILKTHSGHIYVFSYALLSSVVFCKPERDEPVRILKPCSYVRSSGRIRVINQDLH